MRERNRRNDDDSRPIRLTFGSTPDAREERIRALVVEVLGLMAERPNPWANRTAKYEREWDWRVVAD